MRLHLAASPRFVRADGSSVALAPRDAALLAWLALEGPTPRERLAALLWPDSDVDAARNALRQRLFQLRKMTGTDLVGGSTILALAQGVTHDLDHADGVLGEAVHDHSPAFVAWLAQQRERRATRLRAQLVHLSETAEQARDYADALGHAQELLAREPLSEVAHRRVIRLHYLRGDRAAGLLAFDRCEQVLKHEVGAQPSAETLALLATVNAAQTPASTLLTQSVPASVLRPPRLIGRDGELLALQRGWQAGQVVALIGEAGMGKTRLLQDFVDAHKGVVRAAGRPGDAGVPFATLARLLRAVMAHPAAPTQHRLSAVTRTEIARVLPEFEVSAASHTGEGQRLVMQRAVRTLLALQANLAGLVVDDLHFADEASLDMLRALMDEDADSDLPQARPLRWALAYRPAEAGSPVKDLHDALVEQVRLAPITLAPLDIDALAALVDSLALPDVDGTVLAPGLWRRTGGNPLFVLETLKQAWVERTLTRLADDASLPRPVSVGRLIERRIAQLSPAALALARVASIAGVDFSIGMAERVLQATAMQFADALNELEAAHVMRGNAFAHDLVFDAVRASVPAVIASHTHARIAEHLEPLGGEPARIAQHWIDANEAARALPWLARAAAAAAVALRGKEQVAFLERKSQIEEATGAMAAAFESQMLAAKLLATINSGHGTSQCDRLDRLAADMPQRIRARLRRLELELHRGDLTSGDTLAREALRHAIRDGADVALTADCRYHLAMSLVLQDRWIEAIGHFEACISWFDEHASDDRRCEFHSNLGRTCDSLGRIADAVPHHEIAIGLAQRLGHFNKLADCLNNFAANRIMGGHLGEGEAVLVRARQVLAQSGEASSLECVAGSLQAICDYQSGRYRQALQLLDESLVLHDEFAPGYRFTVLLNQCTCWVQLGQWARALQTFELMGERADTPRSTRMRTLLMRHAMDLVQGKCDPQRLDAALALAPESEGSERRHMVLIEMAMIQAPDQGLRLLDELRTTVEPLGHQGTVISVHARSAWVAAKLGDFDRSRKHAHAALAASVHADMVRQYRGELWLFCGAALDACGDVSGARDALASGRAWIEKTAAQHVPSEFRDSFLHRNPVNAELLALATRLGV